MNVLVGINSPGEITILKKYGANEFYCGYLSEKWISQFNKYLSDYDGYKEIFVQINRREKLDTNIKDKTELKKIIDEANKNNVDLYLAMNALYFPETAYYILEEYIKEIYDIGIKNIIVADIGLVYYLRKNYPDINIILSTCQQVNNTWASKFYRDLKIKRITFPRHVTIDEISRISTECPEIEYECFILEGKCIYDDGNCKVCHNLGGICNEDFLYEFHNIYGNQLEYEEYMQLRKTKDFFYNWSNLYPCGMSINGWRNMGCGICVIPELLQLPSISALKIAARGLDIRDKVAMVKFVRKAIILAEKNADRNELMRYGKQIFGWPELCDNRVRCLMAVNKQHK